MTLLAAAAVSSRGDDSYTASSTARPAARGSRWDGSGAARGSAAGASRAAASARTTVPAATSSAASAPTAPWTAADAVRSLALTPTPCPVRTY
jgi:hypothetical protein